MSLYNDPKYFQNQRSDLQNSVKMGTQSKGTGNLKEAFDYFKEASNFDQLNSFKAQTDKGQVAFKVSEVVNGFRSFGYEEEALQIEAFLKAIGQRQPNGEWIFLPQQLTQYQTLIQKKNFVQSEEFTKLFFKSISNDGQKINLQDLRQTFKALNVQNVSASEMIERTSGQSKAQSCTYDQFAEVLRGKPLKREVKVNQIVEESKEDEGFIIKPKAVEENKRQGNAQQQQQRQMMLA